MKISHERLLELLHYDLATGHFLWRVRKGKTVIGARAGNLNLSNGQGYRTVILEGKVYREHVLAWFYVHKLWPKNLIDHKDGVRDNNASLNLREATKSQNGANSFCKRHENIKLRGVKKFRNKYMSSICFQGKTRYLGLFKTPEEANAAHVAKHKELHGEFSIYSRLEAGL